jgi:hypothetical protein
MPRFLLARDGCVCIGRNDSISRQLFGSLGATLNVGRANFYGACPDANYRKIGDAGSKLDPIAVYSPVIRLNRMWGQRDG